MSREKVEAIADGRVFSASQALTQGLIDGISGYEEYKDTVSDRLGEDVGFVDLCYQVDYEELLSSYVSALPSSEIAAVLATIKPLSGPLAYYSGH